MSMWPLPREAMDDSALIPVLGLYRQQSKHYECVENLWSILKNTHVILLLVPLFVIHAFSILWVKC